MEARVQSRSQWPAMGRRVFVSILVALMVAPATGRAAETITAASTSTSSAR